MAFDATKQGLQHQRHEAKLRSKFNNLVDAESEVFSLTTIAALQLSAVGLDLESRPSRIIYTN